ncbi:2-dehydro-3-deoxy-6-phosphogalactonate aldolase [Polymorphobacter multimanifer]|uniref:2-dehydro-3-deoxy-6-phosphogalactonate aldolase n=1 Tax=Polymorphobacter multimanifer TaxID=1070431 RepID=UPI001667CDBE|nr:2-dehydro-3-deoxy-6-phosphogalactonate aldolase [Polymorphobacter multimanifer]GGI91972.1 2-dehydro-3-deoxy-6-phosphogalactonate aldolase [Polymorphobacter multimanifer]
MTAAESISASARFEAAFAACPLVAVLRGIRPDEIEAVGGALIDAGFTILEVPLNSPEPYESITRLSAMAGESLLIGAGTVTKVEEVGRVAAAGGHLIVSPHCDPAVIAASVDADMVCLPGVFTPTEAFAAIHAGAHGLKFFPAEAATPAVIKAMKAVLPRGVPLIAVGGMTPDTMGAWGDAGADGYGLGSNLYRPGTTTQAVAEQAARYVAALKR